MEPEVEIVPVRFRPCSRRHLLEMTTRGFILGASGLLLPETAEDILARDGANGGELGGRRGKNRRGRDKGRNHRKDRKAHDKNDAPGSQGFLRVKLIVYNGRNEDLTVDVKGNFPRTWTDIWHGPLKAGETSEYVGDLCDQLLFTAKDAYVEAYNPGLGYPWVRLGEGADTTNMSINQVVSNSRVEVKRLEDSGGINSAHSYKQFHVRLI